MVSTGMGELAAASGGTAPVTPSESPEDLMVYRQTIRGYELTMHH